MDNSWVPLGFPRVEDGSTGGFGSGVFFTPTEAMKDLPFGYFWLLTANHNIGPAESFGVRLAGKTALAEVVLRSGPHRADGVTCVGADHDYLLAAVARHRLEGTDMTPYVLPLESQPLKFGDTVILAGYPKGQPHSMGGMVCQPPDNGKLGHLFSIRLNNGANSNPGMSGAPVMVRKNNGDFTLTGILNGSNQGLVIATDIKPISAFISNHLETR